MTDIVAISGIREIGVAWYPTVELEVVTEAGRADELRFGGALGVDTVALAAACGYGVPRLVVVPFRVQDQPSAARRVIAACATAVVEMRLPKSKGAYLERNVRMLQGATRLLAFTDGRITGGTAFTIQAAMHMGLEVKIVPVGAARSRNPRVLGLSGPVFAVAPYVSARGGVLEPTSEAIRRLKAGLATKAEVGALADQIATYIGRTPELARADALVPLPRRDPCMSQDLLPLVRAVARRTGQCVALGLRRVEEPKGGVPRLFRLRFAPEEHARSMAAQLPAGVRRPILFDNVVTTGATMEGAMQAVRRDTDAQPVGLGVLFSEQGGLRVAA